jgi:hypothetical protein
MKDFTLAKAGAFGLLLALGVAVYSLSPSPSPSPSKAPTGEKGAVQIQLSTDGADTWRDVDASASPTGISFSMATATNEWLGVVVDRGGSRETFYRVDRNLLSQNDAATFDAHSNDRLTMAWDSAGIYTGVAVP